MPIEAAEFEAEPHWNRGSGNMKTSTIIFLTVIVIMGAAVLYIFDPPGNDAAFSAFSRNEHGTGLLFDTLRHMGYPANISYRPLTPSTNTDHVYIIIQPYAPPINLARAEDIMEWVQDGGRLIYLHNAHPTIFDVMMPYLSGNRLGDMTHYHVGAGEIIIGRASPITNYNMMNNPSAGRLIESTLNNWNADFIWFGGYYHGLQPADNFLTNLPLVVQMVLLQIIIASVFGIWYFGKRFGRVVEAYEETERQENEHVHALARLYKHTLKK